MTKTKQPRPKNRLQSVIRNSQSEIASALVAWFATNQREMPWRKTRDPYCIWLSEIMLQQTQVATVIPYYERFLKTFPTVEDLAAAPLDDVLKLWSGLGYYSRARNLHRGAQVIAQRFNGKMPDTSELIREVPGIGPYTAGAVLSIAYGRPEAIVDGNVARVLSRVFLLEGDYRGRGKDAVWEKARELVTALSIQAMEGVKGRRGEGAKLSHEPRAKRQQPSAWPGDLNQALMELGATICTPRNPDCSRCPIAQFCQARATSKQEEYPQLERKVKVPTWQLRAWVIEDPDGRVLFAQREATGLFGGLWEVPMTRADGVADFGFRISDCGLDGGVLRENNAQGAVSRAANGKQRLSVAHKAALVDKPPVAHKPFAKLKHVLTHRVLKIEAVRIDCETPNAAEAAIAKFECWSGNYVGVKWISPESALRGDIALASIQKTLITKFLEKRDARPVLKMARR